MLEYSIKLIVRVFSFSCVVYSPSLLAVPSDETDHFDRKSPIIYEDTLKYLSEGT